MSKCPTYGKGRGHSHSFTKQTGVHNKGGGGTHNVTKQTDTHNGGVAPTMYRHTQLKCALLARGLCAWVHGMCICTVKA